MPSRRVESGYDGLPPPASPRAREASMTCSHISRVVPQPPRTQGCEECLKIGASWVHLRLCLACGHVGCCDSSSNRHATKHYYATNHPIVASWEPGERWAWCYVDETGVPVPLSVLRFLR